MVFKKNNQLWKLSPIRFKKGNNLWKKRNNGTGKTWNKGLTKENDERVKKYSKRGRLKKSISHLGLKHTEEEKKKISLKLKNKPKSIQHKTEISKTLKEKFKNGEIISFWKGKKLNYVHKKKISETRIKNGTAKLDKNPNWQGGKSFEPYGLDFNENLKEKIRKRDKFICQICYQQINKKLDVHHIDRNKKNNLENNLISLCHHCHIILHNKHSAEKLRRLLE